MSWNYRIVRYRGGKGYGLHEVHYDKSGRAFAMSKEATTFAGDDDEGSSGVIKSLEMALRDARRFGVFDEPVKWPGKAPE